MTRIKCEADTGHFIYLLEGDNCSTAQSSTGQSQEGMLIISVLNQFIQADLWTMNCINVGKRISSFPCTEIQLCILLGLLTFQRPSCIPGSSLSVIKTLRVLCHLAAQVLLGWCSLQVFSFNFVHGPALHCKLQAFPTSLSTNISYLPQFTALLGLKSNDNFTWLRILSLDWILAVVITSKIIYLSCFHHTHIFSFCLECFSSHAFQMLNQVLLPLKY